MDRTERRQTVIPRERREPNVTHAPDKSQYLKFDLFSFFVKNGAIVRRFEFEESFCDMAVSMDKID